MTDTPLVDWLRRFRAADPTPDGELLRRFHARADQDAFELLLHRHAPVVLRVCRAVTRDPHLAEDAAQAAFLVLARRAGSLVGVGSLSAWLVRVAYRVATRARRRTAHPPAPLAAAAAVGGSDPDPAVAAAAADLAAVTLEEVHRLPERYHAPVVLCLLQGLTQAEAADRLGWPPGTVAGRLARAKLALRDRLARRGVVAPAVALAALDANAALARFTTGVLDAVFGPSGPAPRVHHLVQEMTSAMTPFLSRGPVWVASGLLVVATVALALAAGGPTAGPPQPSPTSPAGSQPPPPRGPNRILVDCGGHLTLIDPDGKNETRVDAELAKSMTRDGRLSPDGKRIAFLVVPNPPGAAAGRFFLTEFRLHVMNRDGTEHRAVTADKGVAMTGKLSPDGRRVMYMEFEPPKGTRPPARRFVVADLAAGTTTPVGGVPRTPRSRPTAGRPTGGGSRTPGGGRSTRGRPRRRPRRPSWSATRTGRTGGRC